MLRKNILILGLAFLIENCWPPSSQPSNKECNEFSRVTLISYSNLRNENRYKEADELMETLILFEIACKNRSGGKG